ncbi:MAG TPA: M48 family metalloprotease [Terriglobales bacterium]|nr:M48 family metalloprotease [Terriglobales bacterium]
MNARTRTYILLALLLVGLGRALPAAAQERPHRLPQVPQESGNAMLDRVFARLLAVAQVAPSSSGYASWPPRIHLLDAQKDAHLIEQSKYNAYASAADCVPEINLTPALLEDVIQGDPDRAAMILGHELGHLLLHHTPCSRPAQTTVFAALAYTREKEEAADSKGFELMLAAGFSPRSGLRAFQVLDDMHAYSSFESLASDHPAIKERLARLDTAQASLWRAMAAFDDGVYFLTTEDYPLAERCFRTVIREFPQADEAWANLGYALFMQYADALQPEDLRRFGIGQIVAGGFYRRPTWLAAKVRGIDAEKWSKAVEALQQADKLNPNQALVKANLGTAYLVRPAGSDVPTAVRYLEEARRILQAQADQSVDQASAAAAINNLAVAYAAAGRAEDSAKMLQAANKILGDQPLSFGVPGLLEATAVLYNQSMFLAEEADQESRSAALKNLQDYLRVTSPSSAWWPLAYDRYAKLAGQMGVAPAEREKLQSDYQTLMREVSSVDLGGGKTVILGQPLSELKAALGPGEVLSTASGIVRLRYPAHGLDILADDTRVLAIILESPKAPPVFVRRQGMGSGAVPLRVGMSAEQVDKILADQDSTMENLVDPWIAYRFYPMLGVALRVGAQRTVEELVLVRIPRH